MSLLDQLQEDLDNAREDYEKFVGGNNAAAARVRKNLQSIKKVAQELRLEIQTTKNERQGK